VGLDRITRLFERLESEKRPALVAYLTIGDPSVEESIELASAILEAGADALELGVPFSDPTADGPVIAAASYRAIHQGGSLKAALRVAEAVRARNSDAPCILFSYYNPLLAFGEERLPEAARDAGVDGLLVVDLPPEEGRPLFDAVERAGLGFIPLVAPTSGREREPIILERARGFVYYVSVTGVTGTGKAPLEEAGRDAHALQERARLPVVVGFGIDTPDKARIVARQGVRGVVVGTAIVRAIAAGKDAGERIKNVQNLVSELRAGLTA
jgi:tryptophan synthase alpha chain